MAHIRIVDLPCGYGKSSQIFKQFDKRQNYAVVVPYLSEVDRFIIDAKKFSDFNLTQPKSSSSNKSDHCEKLIRAGKSVVCSHALFYRLGTLSTFVTDQIKSVDGTDDFFGKVCYGHLLDDYNLIIDEVIDPFQIEQTVRQVDFDEDYIGLGLAKVMEDGRVVPTDKWDDKYFSGSKTFSRQLYEKAKSGALYRMGENLFVLTIPTELFLKPKSVTIYTYLSDGSLLLQFLSKLQADNPGTFTMEIERLDTAEEASWREDIANALTVLTISGVENKPWTHNAQLKRLKKHSDCASAAHELRKFKDSELYGVNLKTVMLTSARELWHGSKAGLKPKAGRLAKDARLFGHPVNQPIYDKVTETFVDNWSTTGVSFVPNTTRGTNAYIECTTAVYLYDQHPNPQVLTFLGMKRNSLEARDFCNAYALTELVQWLFRSAIRVGGINRSGRAYQPRRRVTLYMPSERMRNLLLNWLLTGRVNAGPVTPKGPKQIELLARLEGRQLAVAA